ncbi:hypothetical protein BH09PSE5_BH09PSE5_28410 [soil metagenome]
MATSLVVANAADRVRTSSTGRHHGRARQARRGVLWRLADAVSEHRFQARRTVGSDRVAWRVEHGDDAHRPGCHVVDHLQRAFQRGTEDRFAGSLERRPRGLEHRHHQQRRCRQKLRARRPHRTQRPLSPGRGIRAGGEALVGQLGAGSGEERSRQGHLRRHLEDPADRSRGRVLQGARPAERAAQPARQARAGAGRLVRHRHRLCGTACRRGVHRARQPAGWASVLSNHQVEGCGPGGARPTRSR